MKQEERLHFQAVEQLPPNNAAKKPCSHQRLYHCGAFRCQLASHLEGKMPARPVRLTPRSKAPPLRRSVAVSVSTSVCHLRLS